MPLLRQQVRGGSAHLVFIDDNPTTDQVNGHHVVTWQKFLHLPAETRAVCLAVASGAVRERLAGLCDQADLPLIEARAANLVQMDGVSLGAGACLSPFVTLTSNIQIGRAFHANSYSYVEHDCRIGDFVTFAPGVQCNGNVVIGDHAFLGAGAILRQGRSDTPLLIGRGAVVGMGAVVTKDVPAGVTVIGNPARIYLKK
jgi:sugar O-acyltransferase (sialic acid O-acetyltransferase NeuD family)